MSPSLFSHTFKNSTSVLLWIKLIVFLDFFGVGLLTPILPSYLKSAGLSTSELAGLSSIYYLAQLFGGVLFGWLSDKYFTRKQVLILSLIGSALAYLLFGLSKHTILLILSRILVGTVKHTMTICTALLSDMTMPVEEKKDIDKKSKIEVLDNVDRKIRTLELTEKFHNLSGKNETYIEEKNIVKDESLTSKLVKDSIRCEVSQERSKGENSVSEQVSDEIDKRFGKENNKDFTGRESGKTVEVDDHLQVFRSNLPENWSFIFTPLKYVPLLKTVYNKYKKIRSSSRTIVEDEYNTNHVTKIRREKPIIKVSHHSPSVVCNEEKKIYNHATPSQVSYNKKSINKLTPLPSPKRAKSTRTKNISELQAAATVSFIIAPSIGGHLYRINPSYPALLSSIIFITAAILAAITIDDKKFLKKLKNKEINANLTRVKSVKSMVMTTGLDELYKNKERQTKHEDNTEQILSTSYSDTKNLYDNSCGKDRDEIDEFNDCDQSGFFIDDDSHDPSTETNDTSPSLQRKKPSENGYGMDKLLQSIKGEHVESFVENASSYGYFRDTDGNQKQYKIDQEENNISMDLKVQKVSDENANGLSTLRYRGKVKKDSFRYSTSSSMDATCNGKIFKETSRVNYLQENSDKTIMDGNLNIEKKGVESFEYTSSASETTNEHDHIPIFSSSWQTIYHSRYFLYSSYLKIHTILFNLPHIGTLLDEPEILRIMVCRLFYSFLTRSLSPAIFTSYVEQRFGFKKVHLGYLSSYRAMLSLFSQTFIIPYLSTNSEYFSTEESMAKFALFIIVVSKMLETLSIIDWRHYCFLTVPISLLGFSLLDISLKSIFALNIPPGYTGASLGAMSALQSCVGVIAPIYGGAFFENVDIKNRPIYVVYHYIFLGFVFVYFFPLRSLFRYDMHVWYSRIEVVNEEDIPGMKCFVKSVSREQLDNPITIIRVGSKDSLSKYGPSRSQSTSSLCGKRNMSAGNLDRHHTSNLQAIMKDQEAPEARNQASHKDIGNSQIVIPGQVEVTDTRIKKNRFSFDDIRKLQSSLGNGIVINSYPERSSTLISSVYKDDFPPTEIIRPRMLSDIREEDRDLENENFSRSGSICEEKDSPLPCNEQQNTFPEMDKLLTRKTSLEKDRYLKRRQSGRKNIEFNQMSSSCNYRVDTPLMKPFVSDDTLASFQWNEPTGLLVNENNKANDTPEKMINLSFNFNDNDYSIADDSTVDITPPTMIYSKSSSTPNV